MFKHQVWFIFSVLFISLPSYAQSIKWNSPEVVPEKLARENRRVLHLSGTTTPGTQIRIRDNKVKMIFNASKTRWARIPQKHRVQFPVIANDTGYFAFRLYLPTVPVEVPLEMFKGGKWVPYRFSFEVPKSGAAEDFKFVEESFKVRKEEENVKVEDFLAEYDKEEDYGQVVNDRGDWKSWVTGKVIVWGSLGFSYSSMEQVLTSTIASDNLGTFGGMAFPYWEVGGEYRWSSNWKIDAAYLSRPLKAEADGNYSMQNTEIDWTELRGNISFFPTWWEKPTYHLGFKAGLHMHELPLVKRVGVQAYRIFRNNVVFLGAGGAFETMRAKEWNYEAHALLLYPVSVDNEFDMESTMGMHLSFSVFKEIIPALMLGGKVEAHYLSFTATHSEITLPTNSVSSDTTMWQLTPSFLIKAEF